MKRFFAGMAAALLAAVLFFPLKVQAISAGSAVLMDAQTGRVIYEKNPDKQSLIASTTKIMTALIVCEQCNVLDRVCIPKEAVGIEGSSMYLQAGEVLTVQELLYGLMLRSGNDAAVALAIYCGGTVEGFAQLMNDKAHRLGMRSSHFENPHGLGSDEHYSTARDMALLSAYAMRNPIFQKIVSTKSVTIGSRVLKNHNKLLWCVEGADGIKTGYTKAAGRILVSSAVRQGRRLIVVTMNDPNDWKDHADLLTMGFEQYNLCHIVQAGDELGAVEVAGGVSPDVKLVAGEDFSYPLAADEEPTIVLPKPGFVYAPVMELSDAGVAYICLGDTVIGKIRLQYGDSVEQKKNEKRTLFSRFNGGSEE